MADHHYSEEPADRAVHTLEVDRSYSKFARLYDVAIKWLPWWRQWLRPALPHLRGPRVLEVSFGTGFLLSQYARDFDSYGIDYNARMAALAQRNLTQEGVRANLQIADVYALPYGAASFNSVLNTMAFTAYADAATALGEMVRVLEPGGRLIMIDVNYPPDRNRLGMLLARFWKGAGDLIRPMGPLFQKAGTNHTDKTIGGFGTVHLYIATKLT